MQGQAISAVGPLAVLGLVAATLSMQTPSLREAAAEDAVKRVHELTAARERPFGAPKAGDVIMRTLRVHPRNAKDPHDTLRALRDFHVTRLEWAYVTDSKFIGKVKAAGHVFGGAASAPSYYRHGGMSGWERVCVLNLEGEPIIAPWKRAWKHPTLWGCVNNPELERGYMAYLKRCIDAGAQVMQRDEPGANYNATTWGGCFCQHCMEGFREYLAENTTPEMRRKLGITNVEAFDYREHLNKQNAPVGDKFGRWNGGELKRLFVQFQTEATIAFHKRTRRALDDHAGRHVPVSCNNGVRAWGPIQLGFDWGFGELSYRRATPDYIHNAMQAARKHGKLQVVTMPKKGDRKDMDAWEQLTRQTIAMAYACGGHCMVPWDVYMPGQAPRYFGTPQQCADLFGFIRASARYFDGYHYAGAFGKAIQSDLYGETLPIRLEPGRDVHAVVRAVPGDADAPVVVHLIDWSNQPRPFKLGLDPARLYGSKGVRLRLLAPPPYDENAHENAETTGDYRGLSKSIDIDGGYATTVQIPALSPWGMLVIEPDPSLPDGVWEPCIWAADADYYRDSVAVRMTCVSANAAIRYTLDGREPTVSSKRYTMPVRLSKSAAVKARAFTKDGRASGVASASFAKFDDAPTPLDPGNESFRSGLKLWLKADALTDSLSDGSPVRAWTASAGPDARVQQVRLLNGKAAAPPTFKTNALNGRPVIRFDGVDDLLSIKSFSNEYLAGKPFTILTVTQSSDGSFGICGNGLSGTGGMPRLYLTRSAFRYDVLNKPLSLRVAPGVAAITTFVHDGEQTISAYLNGASKGSVSGLPVVPEFGGGHLAIPFWSGNKNRAGDVAELIVFDRRLSGTEREGVEAYLADRYGIKHRRRWR